jgi:hypothetical protein
MKSNITRMGNRTGRIDKQRFGMRLTVSGGMVPTRRKSRNLEKPAWDKQQNL